MGNWCKVFGYEWGIEWVEWFEGFVVVVYMRLDKGKVRREVLKERRGKGRSEESNCKFGVLFGERLN